MNRKKKIIFNINELKISNYTHPLIVPEIGINHSGNIETAFKIVDAAKRAGAKIIKHQTHIADDEYSFEGRKIKPGNSKKNIFQIINSTSLNEEEEYKLLRYVKKKNMEFFSTPFSFKAVDRLVKFKVPVFKVGSGEALNFPLLDYISKFRKKIIISSGMLSLSELIKTINFLKKRKVKMVIMHTTNLYPTPDKLMRLGAITEMKNTFRNELIGFSDHTNNNLSSYGAIALGANIIEKHFTDTKKRAGPDIRASIDEKQLKDLIHNSKIIFDQSGGSKTHIREEQITRNFAYASVVTKKDLAIGEKLNEKNITVKRPGTGHFIANDFFKLIGKKVKKPIKANTQIKKNYIL